MYGWSFSTPTVHDLSRLLRALGKHRYLATAEHSLHFSVDAALCELGGFGEQHDAFQAGAGGLDLASRDPRLWRDASVDEVGDALALFWSNASYAAGARERLSQLLRDAGLTALDHTPFEADPDAGAHPELVRLDWRLSSPDELDTERHAGALRAMERAEEEVDPSEPPVVEAMLLAEPELTHGRAPAELMLWADGPYSYCDYVFRGVAKAAKLPSLPVGYHDIDEL
jgi:hypothetical protein